ncbi:MAG: DUF4168 domain-containing protein [Desulfobacterales bacterium]
MKLFKLTAMMLVLSVAFCFGGAGIAAAGGGEDVYENEIDEETELSKDDIQSKDIKAFLEAAKEIQDIRGKYSKQIREAAEADELEQRYEELRGEAVEKMEQAIEAAGIDKETYRGIAYHLQEDENLLDRINE